MNEIIFILKEESIKEWIFFYLIFPNSNQLAFSLKLIEFTLVKKYIGENFNCEENEIPNSFEKLISYW